MWKVYEKDVEVYSTKTLDDAMVFAKTVNQFVTIKGLDMEFVGMFGIDSIEDGKCPDGVDYSWTKRR